MIKYCSETPVGSEDSKEEEEEGMGVVIYLICILIATESNTQNKDED